MHPRAEAVMDSFLTISITAEGQEREPWRIERIKRALASFNKKTASRNISALRDDKGTLIVTWLTRPTVKEHHAIEAAWDRENEYLVEHILA